MILSKLNVDGVHMCSCVAVALVFVFTLGSVSAEVKVTDNLSLSGFVDMSAVRTDDGQESAATLS